jgi:uncharacterized membrane protein
MNWFALVRLVHIAFGVLAFLVLPVPLIARKGSKVHVSFGRVYVYAMGAVAVTGVPLAARGLLLDDPARRASALFLFYVALLASDCAWNGVLALRAARRTEPRRGLLELGPPTALLCGAVGLFVLGLQGGVVLHILFALLGGMIASTEIRFWLRAPHTRAESLVRHIGGMGVSCITTLTAFLVTNAHHLFHLRTFNIVVWMTPAVLGGIAIGVTQRSWRARLASAASEPTPGESTGPARV